MELSGCRIRRLLSRREQGDVSQTSLRDYERNDSVLDSDSDESLSSDEELFNGTGTTQVPCFIVGGGDTRLCAHPYYKKHQQRESGDRAESSRPVCRNVHETYAAYVTADLAFCQSSLSAAAAPSPRLLDDNDVDETTTIYVVDHEATARLDHVIRLNLDQHTHSSSARFRRSIKKRENTKVTSGLFECRPPALPPKPANWPASVIRQKSDDVLVGKAVNSSSRRPVASCVVVAGDPLLPVRRRKSRHAAVPAAATDAAVTATASDVVGLPAVGRRFTNRQACSDSERQCHDSVPDTVIADRQACSDSERQCHDSVPDTVIADRQACSDSERQCHDSVPDSLTVSSLSTRASASVGNLPCRMTAVTSPDWSNDVAMTSAAAVTDTSRGRAAAVRDDQRPESRDCTTTAIYSEPRNVERRKYDETTTTRRRSSHDASRSSPQTSVRPRSDVISSHQRTVLVDSLSSTSSDNYEPVKYSHSQLTSSSHGESYPQQSRTKQQAYDSVVASIESDGGRVLVKHSVVVVHCDAGQTQHDVHDNDDDDDSTLLCYDRDATALVVASRYVRRHDDPRTQPWCHPVPLTSYQAAVFLRSVNQPGCFLVYRDADVDAGYQLALSLGSEVVVHYDIRVSSSLGDCAVDGDCRRFLSVSELVKYHQQNVGSLATRLRRPLRDATSPPTAGYHFPADVELDRRRLHFTPNIVVGGRGCGVVWAGTYDGQPVAVKVLQRQDTADSQSHQARVDEEFLNETNTLIGLQHDNIVRLVGVCTASRPLLIVTEHGFTGTLKDHLRAATIPSQLQGGRRVELVDIGMQVTAGVAYLASLRYVLHRSISTSSFVVGFSCSDARPRVKLTDFSRARRVSADDCYVADGAELVSVNWAAPEVLSQLRYSSRSDVWAVGVVLWQLFSERCERPFRGLSADQTAVYVASGGRLDCPTHCDDDFYAVMKSCWLHSAECRPLAAVLHRRLAALRSAGGPSRRRSTATLPPPPPPRPSDSSDSRQLYIARSRTSTSQLHSQLSTTFSSSRPTSRSTSDLSHQPYSSRITDDVTSFTDVITRSAAVRIRDSFRKFVTSRKSRPATVTSPLTSPTRRLSDE